VIRSRKLPRIKRLGESSQEIEITELISTLPSSNVRWRSTQLIQAASAGEAGRGFSVVAEDGTTTGWSCRGRYPLISALVKAIQTDTQDAVAAMERSTQGGWKVQSCSTTPVHVDGD
jgi:twitching motility protein PilJ